MLFTGFQQGGSNRFYHVQSLRLYSQFFGIGLLILCAMGCRKKKIERVNVEGKVAILKPFNAREARVKDRLALDLRVYEPEGIQVFDIVLGGQTLWRKAYTEKGLTEVTVQTVLDLSKLSLSSGKHTIVMRIRDQEGQESFSRMVFEVDNVGPKIEWLEPRPQDRIQEITKAELRVTDESDIQKVEVFFENRLLQSLVYPPYLFSLDPTEFPAGIVNFRVVAMDGLGNRSSRMFAFEFAGAGDGVSCSRAESCKSPLVCVKRVSEVRGICRKPCLLSQDCAEGYRCRKVGKFRACLPRNGRQKARYGQAILAGLMEKCGVNQLCRKGLVCVQMADFSSRCLAVCGDGEPPCPKNHVCKKAPLISRSVCLPLKARAALRQIGQSCSEKEPCVKEAVCAREPGKSSSVCYRKCETATQCPAQHKCRQIPGQSYGICTYVAYEVVGAYQRCSPRQRCEYGYQCISTASNPAPRCFPSCKESGCSDGAVCVRSGAYAVCLQKCNPQESSCPEGTSCGGTQTGTTLLFLCR